ncbi:tryptophan synthase subunit alpha [Sporosarcina sp. HYO08]|uniref:tryptophan synthase subunit alpha n=1 Tax=Sporosarcina sp. HYO08 TaxID=1759557 RepID=UPI000791CBFC|nr:tryptophan synthase subunit alpha [Sporosarcina sp. HYO08]KXH80680.1 tryptophan synthase subunit alpha [Sporosarcina sp. HYO08]
MTKKRLTTVIEAVVQQGEKAFVPYIMAGDGGLEKLRETILFLQEIGVTAIEVGIPFSDPVADGTVIQTAGERALAKGVTLRKVMDELAAMREEVQIPIVIMTYLNPVLQYDLSDFVKDCQTSGVSGLIVPDLPLEESALLQRELEGSDTALIQLVSLTSPEERIEKITAAGEGFIYAVTVNGITGVRDGFETDLAAHFKKLQAISPIPVLAGFGISTPEQVREMGELADGVIVGSAIVDALHREDLETVKSLVQAAKKEIHQ